MLVFECAEVLAGRGTEHCMHADGRISKHTQPAPCKQPAQEPFSMRIETSSSL